MFNRPWKVFSAFFLLSIALYFLMNRMPEHIDKIYFHARIYTMDKENTVVDAFAVNKGRIVGRGKIEDLTKTFTADTMIDVDGKTVLPGLIDAHCHLLGYGLNSLTVDLSSSPSEQSAATLVAQQAANDYSVGWIRGSGWDQNKWNQKSFPSKKSLDKLIKDIPVLLLRVDGHACWVNSKAMEIAGVTKTTPNINGGTIIRDQNGEPSGVFIDAAMDLIFKILPEPSEREMEHAVSFAMKDCLSYGLTSVQEMEADKKQIDVYKKMILENNFPLRVYSCIDGPGELWETMKHDGPLIGFGDNHLTIRAMKLYIDGSLGSRSAAMIDPYSDDPANRGITVVSHSALQTQIDECLEHQFQVCTHAIGDRANDLVLNAYETALAKYGKTNRRLRIEHAQVLTDEDISRFAPLGIIPSMQPIHCTSDMPWVEARLGHKRTLHAYAWRSLLNTGSIIAGGSDFPVESPNPMLGIYAACTRQDIHGYPRNANDVSTMFQLSADGIVDPANFSNGWYANQRMTREEAVRAFTTWAAYASFEENLKGSIEDGKVADFVVLSEDVFQVPLIKIPSIKVEKTFIGGREVFRKY